MAISASFVLVATVLNLPSVQAVDMCNPDAAWQAAGVNCPAWYGQFKVELNNTSVHNPQAYDDANGPAPYELVRPIPADPAIPSRFVGLSDILLKDPAQDAPIGVQQALAATAPTSAPIHAVLDAQMYGTVQAYLDNDFEPTAYFGAQSVGHTITMPDYTIVAWYGFWQENNGDNSIEDQSCTQPYFCGPQDEFVWRGSNTNESMEGMLWDYPAPYNPNVPGVVGVGIAPGEDIEAGGMAGNCQAYAQYDADCFAPGPVSTYWDQSNWTTGQQSWPVSGGGAALAPEESLLVNHYMITVFGPLTLGENSNYSYQVDAPASTPGFFRAMDWYQALAPGSVASLYSSSLFPVRDAVNNVTLPTLPIPTTVTDTEQNASDDAFNTCPSQASPGQASVCARDTRQIVALANQASVSPAGSLGAPFLSANLQIAVPDFTYLPTGNGQPFSTYWCAQVGQPSNCMSNVPPAGTIGYLFGVGAPLGAAGKSNGETSYMPGTFLVGATQAFVWDDNNHDGYIGSPDQHTIDQYLAGNYPTANVGGGDSILGVAPQIQTLTVTPLGGGWPAGSFLVYNAANPYDSGPLGPPDHQYFTPLAGTTPVTLPMDPTTCQGAATGCVTRDGLFIPEGTLTGLAGDVHGTVGWVETTGTVSQSYSFTSDYQWTQSV
ncbi:MAG: hypothetical protein ACYDDF_14290 [Thermoplasmatota archaeon]